jgi:hypothetical protein
VSVLATALLVGIRIGVPGWLWSAPLSRQQMAGAGPRGLLGRVGRALALGLALNLLLALFPAQISMWTPANDWALWAVVLVGGGLFRKHPGGAPVSVGLAAVGLTAFLTAAALLSPPRSEWLAGGWDPGIYQNQAVAVARANGFSDRKASVYAELTPEERARIGREAFRGVPLAVGTGALQHHFFQLMPMCGALLFRWGGFALLFRVNQLLALLALPVFWALAEVAGIRGWRRAAVAGALGVSPLWWYHQAIPTTEMLQLVLVAGAAAFYLDAERREVRVPWGAALLLAAVGINHFGFPPLAAGMLAVAAGAEAVARRSGRLQRFAVCGVALAAGLLWDLAFSAVTLRSPNVLPSVRGILLLFLIFIAAGALASLAGLVFPRPVGRLGVLARWSGVAGGVFLIGMAVAVDRGGAAWVETLGALAAVGPGLHYLSRFIPFDGAGWFLLAGLGAVLLSCDTRQETRRARILAWVLACGVLLMIVRPGIAPIYPWALRRPVPLLLPLMALLIGYGLTLPTRLLVRCPAWMGRAAVAVLLLAAAVAGIRHSRKAARVGDYVGYPAALAELNQLVRDGDVIVADDGRPGACLLLAHGRDVLPGQVLARSGDPTRQEEWLRTLRRLADKPGRRILWLTSTDQGMGWFTNAVGRTRPLSEPVSVRYATVMHGKRVTTFETRSETRPFQLHLSADER